MGDEINLWKTGAGRVKTLQGFGAIKKIGLY